MLRSEGPLTVGGPDPRMATAKAALDWWALAGVDTPVGALPRSWLDVVPAPEPRGKEGPMLATRPAVRRPGEAMATPGDGFAGFDTLAAFHAHVRAGCPGVPLFDGVAGSGVLVMGESPSATDLETGRPFTGPAGQLLDRMLAAIGLDRSRCGISLVAPRRTAPGPPSAADIEADLPLTLAHVRLLAPSAVLLLGATPTRVLTGETAPISTLRGRPLAIAVGGRTIAALATFNPAYLLRRPEEKALAWADLLAFRALLAEKGQG